MTPLLLFLLPGILCGFPVFGHEASYEAVYDQRLYARLNGTLVYRYSEPKDEAIQINVWSTSHNISEPIFVIIGYPTSHVAGMVQFHKINANTYDHAITRIVCPLQPATPATDPLTVLVTSASTAKIGLLASPIENISLPFDTKVKVVAKTMVPVFKQFTLTDGIDDVVFRITSTSNACSTVFLGESCPVFNSEDGALPIGSLNRINVTANGTLVYQRVDSTGNKTIYITFLVHDRCSHPHQNVVTQDKEFFVIVKSGDGIGTLKSVLITVIILFGIHSAIYLSYRKYEKGRLDKIKKFVSSRINNASSTSLHTEVSKLVKEKHIVLSDTTCNTSFKQRETKFNSYVWNVVAFGCAFGLPVAQLLSRITSYDDKECYFNHLCSYKALEFLAFNSMFSNIGYAASGLNLIVLTRLRNYTYETVRGEWKTTRESQEKKVSRDVDSDFERHPTIGIPPHNGLTIAIACSIIAEGLLSLCYHICPSKQSFQFDTTFMLVIAMLTMLKLYQHRHQELCPSAAKFMIVMAITIVLTAFGYQLHKWSFQYIVAFVIVWIALVALEIKFIHPDVHFMRLIRDRNFSGLVNNLYEKIYSTNVHFFAQAICFGIVFVAISVYFILWIPNHEENHFENFELIICMTCLTTHIAYYGFMKVMEKCKHCPRGYAVALVASFLFFGLSAATGGFFFTRHVSDWSKSHEESNSLNDTCFFLFYDYHGIWHLISSFALLFMSIFVMIIDDNVDLIERNEIVVF